MWFFDSGYFIWKWIPIFYCPGEERIFVAVFAGVDAIEMSSATQNWLKMPDG